jgi:hypothetical protein
MTNGRVWSLVGLGLLVFAAGNACSDTDEGTEVANHGGAGEGGEAATPGGTTTKGGSAGAAGSGGAEQGGMGGDGGMGGVEQGGMGGDGGMGGVGCTLEDECGGCEEGHLQVKCSWGDVDVSDYPSETGNEVREACAYARNVFEGDGGAGGAGGASLGGAEQGGAASQPGLCETYVSPGTRITGCRHCTETMSEWKSGECVIRDECCVVAFVQGCAP